MGAPWMLLTFMRKYEGNYGEEGNETGGETSRVSFSSPCAFYVTETSKQTWTQLRQKSAPGSRSHRDATVSGVMISRVVARRNTEEGRRLPETSRGIVISFHSCPRDRGNCTTSRGSERRDVDGARWCPARPVDDREYPEERARRRDYATRDIRARARESAALARVDSRNQSIIPDRRRSAGLPEDRNFSRVRETAETENCFSAIRRT